MISNSCPAVRSWFGCRRSKLRDPLDDREHREATNGVRWDSRARQADRDLRCRTKDDRDGGDEQELRSPALDPVLRRAQKSIRRPAWIFRSCRSLPGSMMD